MQVLEQFWEPMISTSANVSWDQFPSAFDIVSKSIISQCDYVVAERLDTWTHKPSTIIGFDDNELFGV